MKDVIFTVGLNFTMGDEGEEGSDRAEDESDVEGLPPLPSIRACAKSESSTQ